MSGGAIVVTGRVQREGAPARMIPLIVGVLTRYYAEHFTFVATRIEHIWATIGHGSFASQPLYSRKIVPYRPSVSSSSDLDV